MPVTLKHYESSYKNTWCPGCGNFGMWIALKNALVELQLKPENVLIAYDIGCSGNGVNFTKTFAWHSLHGRPLPTGVGAKLANKDLTVIVVAGDGGGMGEGMGHFIHALRGNANITYIIHDNKTYSLTTGQASPTSEKGYKSKSTPEGIIEEAANPIALALAAGGSFIARGFAGDADHLKDLYVKAIKHRGLALLDVFQPCVTFNKVNTFKWYFDRLYNLDKDKTYNSTDSNSAWQQSQIWGNKISYGLIYQRKRSTYDDHLPQLAGKALVKRPMTVRNIDKLTKTFA